MMEKVFYLRILLVLCILLPINGYSQKKMRDYPNVGFVEKDLGDTLVLCPLEISGINVRIPNRTYDVFACGSKLSDREMITISGETYMVDSLLYDNYSEYAGTYDFERIYMVEKSEKKYYIIDFYNAFQMGTMVQPCYMILSIDGGMPVLHSIYMQTDIEDNSGRIENTVRVYFENDNIRLEGVNMELIKTFL